MFDLVYDDPEVLYGCPHCVEDIDNCVCPKSEILSQPIPVENKPVPDDEIPF